MYQIPIYRIKAKRFLIFFLKHRKDSDYLPCLHKEAERTCENTSFISSYGLFSDVERLYMLPCFVQGEQFAVRHIGDERAVGKGAFVETDVFGIGLQEGLSGGVVDELHGDALYGSRGGIGRQLHQLFEERFFHRPEFWRPYVPVRSGYTCGKRGTEPARTEALASPPANKLSPR